VKALMHSGEVAFRGGAPAAPVVPAKMQDLPIRIEQIRKVEENIVPLEEIVKSGLYSSSVSTSGGLRDSSDLSTCSATEEPPDASQPSRNLSREISLGPIHDALPCIASEIRSLDLDKVDFETLDGDKALVAALEAAGLSEVPSVPTHTSSPPSEQEEVSDVPSLLPYSQKPVLTKTSSPPSGTLADALEFEEGRAMNGPEDNTASTKFASVEEATGVDAGAMDCVGQPAIPVSYDGVVITHISLLNQ